jgi:cytochrome b6-f complex iron-sulfur subunit
MSEPAPAKTADAPAPGLPKTPVAPPLVAPHYVPVETRRGFLNMVAVGWGAFAAASAFGIGLLTRFMFPNVNYEPPQTFKAGYPTDFPTGVDERFKARYGVWMYKGYDPATKKTGFFALSTTCTHLGCTPNWLLAEAKFKCPCHGSGFQPTGINFEGPAPRPLERFAIRLGDDGQIVVDKTKKFQQEKGEWSAPSSFLEFTV